MSTGIAEFVRARLAEAEARARSAAQDGGDRWHYNGHSIVSLPEHDTVATGTQDHMEPHHAHHIAAHDPASVLRQVAALGAIAREHGPSHKHTTVWEWDEFGRECYECGTEPCRELNDCPICGASDGCTTLRQLAAIWPDHEDYKPGWAL